MKLLNVGNITSILFKNSLSSLTLAISLSSLSMLLVYLYYTHVDHHKKAEKLSASKIIFESYKWTWRMFLIPGGICAFSAYLTSEFCFYPQYFIDVLPKNSIWVKLLGISIAFDYLLGVVTLHLSKWNDKQGIIRGGLVSTISIIVLGGLVLLKNLDIFTAHSYLQAPFLAGFVFGFGWFIPALFSALSRRIHAAHAARLFGAIDSTDTAAIGASSFGLELQQQGIISKNFFNILITVVFIFSFRLFLTFTKKIKRFESNVN